MNVKMTRAGQLVAGAGLAAVLAACGRGGGPANPDEARARGEALLKEMSSTLASAQSVAFETREDHERVRRNGDKAPYTLRREVIARRPDRLRYHATGGDDRDFVVTYDGRQVTVVGATHRVYARIDAPSTLDGMLAQVEQRYELPLPFADVLYSDPYASFSAAGAEGGWVATEIIDGQECEKVQYRTERIDFAVWVSAPPRLPCRLEAHFKAERGSPTSRLTFSKWQLGAAAEDGRFVAQVPEGYEQIPIVERIPKTELKSDAAKAMGARQPVGTTERGQP
jgi:hypothetical protein